jgi:hypothetical protein
LGSLGGLEGKGSEEEVEEKVKEACDLDKRLECSLEFGEARGIRRGGGEKEEKESRVLLSLISGEEMR